MATEEELSGIFAVTVATAAGRTVYTEGDRDEVDFWLSEFRKAERLALVVERELPVSEAHGIWSSPGS